MNKCIFTIKNNRTVLVRVLTFYFIVIALIITFLFIKKINSQVTAESWVGEYSINQIYGEDYNKYSSKRIIDVRLWDGKLCFILAEISAQGAFLYGGVGDAVVLRQQSSTLKTDTAKGCKRTIHICGDLRDYAIDYPNYDGGDMYVEFVLLDNKIKMRYCDGDHPEDIYKENFTIFSKE